MQNTIEISYWIIDLRNIRQISKMNLINDAIEIFVLYAGSDKPISIKIPVHMNTKQDDKYSVYQRYVHDKENNLYDISSLRGNFHYPLPTIIKVHERFPSLLNAILKYKSLIDQWHEATNNMYNQTNK